MTPDQRLPAPVVILGGFLSFPGAYGEMHAALRTLTGQPVTVAGVHTPEWLLNVSRLGWAHLLHKLDRAVRQAARQSPTGRVVLVGHSIGGVLARLYLSPAPFLGRSFRGLDYAERLITLGSPHYNDGGTTRGGHLARWVEQRYPGAYFAPGVTYTAVAGRLCRGDREGSGMERMAYHAYRPLCGDGSAWGDGIIPVSSALLRGAEPITLDDVGHFAGLSRYWYGDRATVERWWRPVERAVPATGEPATP